MLIITGTVSQTRTVKFTTGDATFLELISKGQNRQTQVYEVRLPDDMPVDQFVEGETAALAVSVGAKNNRAYFSALRAQPQGYPKVGHAA